MIEVNILKVTHYGANEAKKLIPYIQKADIFSPENGACTESDAAGQEARWRFALKNEDYFEKFMELFDQSEDSYGKAVYMSLFKAQKPMFFLERFTPQQAEWIMHTFALSQELEFEALNYLGCGLINQFVKTIEKSIQVSNRTIEFRDRHIAFNAATIEARIREDNPQFKQESVVLYGFLGSAHEPEKYEPSIHAENLSNKKDFNHQFYSEARKLPFNERELLTLQWGLYHFRYKQFMINALTKEMEKSLFNNPFNDAEIDTDCYGAEIRIVNEIRTMDLPTVIKEIEKLKNK